MRRLFLQQNNQMRTYVVIILTRFNFDISCILISSTNTSNNSTITFALNI